MIAQEKTENNNNNIRTNFTISPALKISVNTVSPFIILYLKFKGKEPEKSKLRYYMLQCYNRTFKRHIYLQKVKEEALLIN